MLHGSVLEPSFFNYPHFLSNLIQSYGLDSIYIMVTISISNQELSIASRANSYSCDSSSPKWVSNLHLAHNGPRLELQMFPQGAGLNSSSCSKDFGVILSLILYHSQYTNLVSVTFKIYLNSECEKFSSPSFTLPTWAKSLQFLTCVVAITS